MNTKLTTQSKNYISVLEDIKSRVKSAQIKAHLSVNQEMIKLYWEIGKTILDKQSQYEWGSSVIDSFSRDLKKEFGTLKGFSSRNLRKMRTFASEYPDFLSENSIWPQLVAKLPWGHNIELISKVKNKDQRLWYAKQTVENGWSRNILMMQIESNLYERQAKNEIKTNNFQLTLPAKNSDLVSDIFKDEYNFEFIDNSNRLQERQLEKSLTDNVINFLTELGKGFAFVGKQYHLQADEEDYYIDLLFYHLDLRSYIIIELKTTKFKPEYAGKMAFYLSQIDKKLKKNNDNNSLGIILCPDSSSKQAKETINYITKPMGVAGYQLAENKKEIPKELRPIEDLKKIIKVS